MKMSVFFSCHCRKRQEAGFLLEIQPLAFYYYTMFGVALIWLPQNYVPFNTYNICEQYLWAGTRHRSYMPTEFINYAISYTNGPFAFNTSNISSSVLRLKSPGMVFFSADAVREKSRHFCGSLFQCW